MAVAITADATIVAAAAAGTPMAVPPGLGSSEMRDHAVVRFEQAVDDAAAPLAASPARTTFTLASRLLIVRLVADRVAWTVPIRLPLGG